MTRPEETVPVSWCMEINHAGETEITCAMGAGASRNFLVALGAIFCALGIWGVYWLLTGEGELTWEGYVSLLMPAGVVLCGVYALDAALYARSWYLLGANRFSARKVSLLRTRRRDIVRQSLVAIRQKYTPPDPTASSTTPGDWVTFLAYDAADGKGVCELALDGTHTAEETQWLATMLSHWAGVPVEKGFAAEVAAADALELPPLPSEKNA